MRAFVEWSIMRAAFEMGFEASAGEGRRATAEERPSKSTIAISTAVLVCWTVVALTLLSESWFRQESTREENTSLGGPVLELRKSFIPPEISGSSEISAQRAATDASGVLHIEAKPV
jgi:hypothetical protein